MTHASVFSGIGGPEVAAAMLGWDNLFHCEINPFGRRVLEYHFPNSVSYEDIKKTDFSQWRGRVDVLTGGFPCQPFSYAGRRAGAEDDRYLWPEMLRAISECQPTWVVGENVSGITTMVEQESVVEVGAEATLFEDVEEIPGRIYKELGRYTIDRVCSDLEAIGYAVQPVLIPACAVGAPHRRDRVFIIAYANSMGRSERWSETDGREEYANDPRIFSEFERLRSGEPSANSADAGLESMRRERQDTVYGLGTIADTYCERREEPEQSGRRAHSPEEGAGMDDRTERYGCDGFATDTESQPSEPANEREDGFTQQRQFGRESCETVATDTASLGGRQVLDNLEQELANGAEPFGNGCKQHATDTSRNGLEGMLQREEYEDARRTRQTAADTSDTIRSISPGERWNDFPTVSPVHRGNDGLPFDVDDLTIPFTQWRTESLKAYGNAIVPQVMYEIFRAIDQIENNPKS